MTLLSTKLACQTEEDGRARLQYWCPACNELHSVIVNSGAAGQDWTWNGDANLPVISPSVSVKRDMWVPPVTPDNLAQWRAAPWAQHKEHQICNASLGTNGAQPGQVYFWPDSTHAMAGTVQPFPDLPAVWQTDLA